MYDLILKGGTVIDPSTGTEGVHDIVVHDGKIEKITNGDLIDECRKVIDVSGNVVTPGLIDVHIHVADGITFNGLDPDLVGVRAGVTTLVDAGTTGSATFGGFPRHIIPNSHTEIVPFLHICQTGLATIPDVIAEGSIDIDSTEEVLDKHQGLIRGIKVRMVTPALDIFGIEMARLAKRIAKDAGVKLMVHIGDTQKKYDTNIIRDLLPIVEEGDIITHLFTPHPGGVLGSDGKLVPEAKEASDRGVWLDTAYGRTNFAFNVGRKVLDQGLVPHCISTDMTIQGRPTTVHSLTEMMSRFLGFGFTLGQVVTMCTSNPARAIGEEKRLGSLIEGRQADISVLKIRDGDWVVHDALNDEMKIDKAVVPVLTIKRGEVFEPDWGPRPWGWEPDLA